MGLLFKLCPAHEGSNDTTSQVRSQREVIENVGCHDLSVRNEDVIGSSSRRYLTEKEQSGRPASPDLPLRYDSLLRDPSFLTHRHPLFGPFQNFPGTQFWEFWQVYWQRKKMIKWHHRQILTKNMSIRNFQRCVRDMSNHHSNLLQSIENQIKHDGIAKGPLLYLLVDDHGQLLITSQLVLRYFHIFCVPAILAGLEQNYLSSSETSILGAQSSYVSSEVPQKFVLNAEPVIETGECTWTRNLEKYIGTVQ